MARRASRDKSPRPNAPPNIRLAGLREKPHHLGVVSIDSIFVVTCEHASRLVPEGEDLGVTAQQLDSHAAWDPGAADAARALASRLPAPVVLGRHTRLFVDLNRSADNDHVIPEVCYGVPVPANRGLTSEERQHRLRSYHAPYRLLVRDHAERAIECGGRCIMIAVHSFTPELDPDARCFDIGLLFDRSRPWESEAADRLRHALTRHQLTNELNRPYDGQEDSVLSEFRRTWTSPIYVGLAIEINQRIMSRDGWERELVNALGEGLREVASV